MSTDVPGKCHYRFYDPRQIICLKKECAKECNEMGGDELYTYTGSDYNIKYACCQSKTMEQKQDLAEKKSSCRFSCQLVTHLLD
jgi:hypothetical protein